MMTSVDVVSAMTDVIVHRFHPLRVILFGSQARGDTHPTSDVDFLVVTEDGSNKRATAVAIRRALSDFPVCKDVVVTTPDEIARRGNLVGSVLRPALRDGIVVYERR